MKSEGRGREKNGVGVGGKVKNGEDVGVMAKAMKRQRENDGKRKEWGGRGSGGKGDEGA